MLAARQERRRAKRREKRAQFSLACVVWEAFGSAEKSVAANLRDHKSRVACNLQFCWNFDSRGGREEEKNNKRAQFARSVRRVYTTEKNVWREDGKILRYCSPFISLKSIKISLLFRCLFISYWITTLIEADCAIANAKNLIRDLCKLGIILSALIATYYMKIATTTNKTGLASIVRYNIIELIYCQLLSHKISHNPPNNPPTICCHERRQENSGTSRLVRIGSLFSLRVRRWYNLSHPSRQATRRKKRRTHYLCLSAFVYVRDCETRATTEIYSISFSMCLSLYFLFPIDSRFFNWKKKCVCAVR